jgi:uncharacterized protein DUF6318
VTRGWTRQLVACLAAGGVVLSGCSDRQEANDTLPEADASPSASESVLPPLGPPDLPMPAEARTQDAAGAEAFVRYYIDLINRTSTVMDAAPLRKFSQGCTECERIASNTEGAAANGQKFQDGEISIIQMGKPLIANGTAQLALRVDQARFVVVDASGAPVDGGSEAYTNVSGGVALEWNSSRTTWSMTQLTFGH